ncbi:MAG: hypothetical protein ABGX12_06210 [Desulfurobacteriaceae bacterium]
MVSVLLAEIVEMPEKVDGIATKSGSFSRFSSFINVETPEKVDGISFYFSRQEARYRSFPDEKAGRMYTDAFDS